MPPQLTAQDFDQELLILFDAYVHGDMDRRMFLRQAQRFAKAGMTAAGLLAALSPNFAMGQQVRADDARLKTESVTIPSPQKAGPPGSAWSAAPATSGCASSTADPPPTTPSRSSAGPSSGSPGRAGSRRASAATPRPSNAAPRSAHAKSTRRMRRYSRYAASSSVCSSEEDHA